MSENELTAGLATCTLPPNKPLGLFTRLFAPAENEFETLPKAAYDAPIWTTFEAFGKTTVVNDPDAVRRVLVENASNYPKHPRLSEIMRLFLGDGIFLSVGDKWRAHRRAIQPSLTEHGVESYYDIIFRNVCGSLEAWNDRVGIERVDIVKEMSALTFGITAECLFDTSSEGARKAIVESIASVEESLSFVSMFDLLPIVGSSLLKRKMKKMLAISAPFDQFLEKICGKMDEPNVNDDNVLTRLTEAQPPASGRANRKSALYDEARTLLFAGSDTSALVLSFAIYVLAKRDDIERLFHSEIDRVCGKNPLTVSDLSKLVYTRMLLEEVMRLYPPAPVLTYRQAQTTDRLCGEIIPAGRTIKIMPWLLHRSERNWVHPERFDPERFAPDAQPSEPYAFIPFGVGRRSCVGKNIAMLEMIMILVMISQKYRFVLLPQPKLVLRHRITLRPRDGIMMKIMPR